MYCPSCGKEPLPGAAFCPNCGLQISAGSEPVSNRNSAARPQTGDGSRLAKGLTALLGGALAGACGLSAAGLLVVGAYLMFRFAQGAAVALPWFLAETLLIGAVRGGALLFIGLAILLAAVLLSIAAGTLVQGLKFLLRNPAETVNF